jgi:hypothetical protein
MGVKASRLVVIDVLKGLCGGGVDVPLTEDHFFDENGEIDDEKFEDYVMRDDDEDAWKEKLRIALANMVGQR